MSMIVARMQKMKSENLVGIGNHNQRKTSRHSNPDIDVERSYLNYDLVNRTENYKTDIEHYINTHKTTKKAVRTDAVLVNEWIITSDTAFFSSLSEAEQRRFFQSATNFFAERYGDENIRYATVHLDERTPHMHLGIVPFTADYKLSAKTLFDRIALKAIQEELPSYLREQGFDIVRGKENSQAKHLDTPEFKEKVRHLEILDKEIQRNQTRLFQQMALEDNVKTLLHDPISEVPDTSYTKVPLNKVLVDKDDFEQLQSAAHRFKSLCRQQRAQLFNQTKDIERLQNKIHYMEREEQQKENERQVRFDYQKSLLEREMKEKRIELDDIRRNLKQREEKIEKRMLGLGYLEERIEKLMNHPEYADREKMIDMRKQINQLNKEKQVLAHSEERLIDHNAHLTRENQALKEQNTWLENAFELAKQALLTTVKALNVLVLGKKDYGLNLNQMQSDLLRGIHQFIGKWLEKQGDKEKADIAKNRMEINTSIQRESGLYPPQQNRKKERTFELER